MNLKNNKREREKKKWVFSHAPVTLGTRIVLQYVVWVSRNSPACIPVFLIFLSWVGWEERRDTRLRQPEHCSDWTLETLSSCTEWLWPYVQKPPLKKTPQISKTLSYILAVSCQKHIWNILGTWWFCYYWRKEDNAGFLLTPLFPTTVNSSPSYSE